LLSVNADDTNLAVKMDSGAMDLVGQSVIQQVVNEHGVEAHTRLQFIISSYFRTRTIHFMYAFSRNNFKMGPAFKRELIQPFHLMSFLMLPWLVLDIFDSFLCRLIYTKYCPKCGWKFYKLTSDGDHDHMECEYNREYKEVINSILDGSIMRKEDEFRRLGMMRRSAGRRSAYWELCHGKQFFSSVFDIICIWFSICLWLILLIAICFPSVIAGVYMLEL
jgi:hypothetical protein